MKLNIFKKPYGIGIIFFMIFTISYFNWLIVFAKYGIAPDYNFCYFLTLPFISILSIIMVIFKIKTIELLITPIVFYGVFSYFLGYLIKKIKWHSLSYIINIYLVSVFSLRMLITTGVLRHKSIKFMVS